MKALVLWTGVLSRMNDQWDFRMMGFQNPGDDTRNLPEMTDSVVFRAGFSFGLLTGKVDGRSAAKIS